MTPVVLALDLGSSGVKGRGYDTAGHLVPDLTARAPFSLRPGPGGAAEVDLPRLAAPAEAVLDEITARLEGRPVLAVACASFASSLVALDAAGKPLGPALSYADTRAAPELEALGRDPDRLERTGCPDHPAYWPAQIMWWRREHPALVDRVARWVSAADWLYGRWFGPDAVQTSPSLAAWTGLLDRRALRWDGPLLEEMGEPLERFPVISDEPLLGLRPEFASRWPALARMPFFPAVGDGAAVNVGSGALGRERVAVTIGTTAALRVALPGRAPGVPPGLWAYLVDADTALVGGALTEGGNIAAWLRSSLRLGDLTTLEARLAALPPARHGLAVLPTFAGERSPGYRPRLRGALAGLSLATTPLELYRAGLEAVALRLADLAGRLAPVLDPEPVYLAGGGALLASPVWMQTLADALGAPVLECAEPEATARGAALLALGKLGLTDPRDPPPPPYGRRFAPNAAAHDRYREALERQRRLYGALEGGP